MQQIPMYLRPSEVKQYIGISQKTLNDLKDEVFQKGIHYFIPPGLKHPLWYRDALLSWVQGDSEDEARSIVDDILHNT